MADDIDLKDKVLAMKQGQFSIRELLARQGDVGDVRNPEGTPPPAEIPEARAEPAAETLPSLDDVSPLPRPGDPYTAYSRPSNKPMATLVLLLSDSSCRGYSYANLDTLDLVASDVPGQGVVIVARFSGIRGMEVRLAGRHLDRLYSLLTSHRVGWARELAPSRDFIPTEDTVITHISISQIDRTP